MIVLKDVSKTLGNKEILQHVSFHIGAGESVGIIGKNGAGKTTLLNVIAGVLKPDDGFVRVNGLKSLLEPSAGLRNMVYVSGAKSQLWEDLKIRDSFDNCIKMYQVDKQTAIKRMDLLSDAFRLSPLLLKRPKDLSLGEKMRCELVYGLLAQPPLLLLDEAMIGLDVSNRHAVMEYLASYNKQKQSTMLVTSHNLLEVEKLCDRVILLDKGKVLFDGGRERLMRDFAPFYHMEVKIRGMLPDFEDLPLEKFCFANETLDVVFDKKKIETAQILGHIMQRCEIEDVKLYEPNLEETIRKIYERED